MAQSVHPAQDPGKDTGNVCRTVNLTVYVSRVCSLTEQVAQHIFPFSQVQGEQNIKHCGVDAVAPSVNAPKVHQGDKRVHFDL